MHYAPAPAQHTPTSGQLITPLQHTPNTSTQRRKRTLTQRLQLDMAPHRHPKPHIPRVTPPQLTQNASRNTVLQLSPQGSAKPSLLHSNPVQTMNEFGASGSHHPTSDRTPQGGGKLLDSNAERDA